MNNIKLFLISTFSLVVLVFLPGCNYGQEREKFTYMNGCASKNNVTTKIRNTGDYPHFCASTDGYSTHHIEYDDTNPLHKYMINNIDGVNLYKGDLGKGSIDFFWIFNNYNEAPGGGNELSHVECATQISENEIEYFPVIDFKRDRISGTCVRELNKDFKIFTFKAKGSKIDAEFTYNVCEKDKGNCSCPEDPTYIEDKRYFSVSSSTNFVGKLTLNDKGLVEVTENTSRYCVSEKVRYTDVDGLFYDEDSRAISRENNLNATQSNQICKSVGDSKINLGITSSGQMQCEGNGALLKDGAKLEVKNSVGSIASKALRESENGRTTKTTEYIINRADLQYDTALSCPDTNGTKVIQRETSMYLGDEVVGKTMGFFDENGDECKFLTGYEECTKYEANPNTQLAFVDGMSIKQSEDKYGKIQRTYSLGSETTTITIIEGEAYICGEEK